MRRRALRQSMRAHSFISVMRRRKTRTSTTGTTIPDKELFICVCERLNPSHPSGMCAAPECARDPETNSLVTAVVPHAGASLSCICGQTCICGLSRPGPIEDSLTLDYGYTANRRLKHIVLVLFNQFPRWSLAHSKFIGKAVFICLVGSVNLVLKFQGTCFSTGWTPQNYST